MAGRMRRSVCAAGSVADERRKSNGGATMVGRAQHRLRLLALMSQGPPGAVAETWQCYGTLDQARSGAFSALRDARVLGVAIVDDHNGPLRLVEWMPSHTADDRSIPFQVGIR